MLREEYYDEENPRGVDSLYFVLKARRSCNVPDRSAASTETTTVEQLSTDANDKCSTPSSNENAAAVTGAPAASCDRAAGRAPRGLELVWAAQAICRARRSRARRPGGVPEPSTAQVFVRGGPIRGWRELA